MKNYSTLLNFCCCSIYSVPWIMHSTVALTNISRDTITYLPTATDAALESQMKEVELLLGELQLEKGKTFSFSLNLRPTHGYVLMLFMCRC